MRGRALVQYATIVFGEKKQQNKEYFARKSLSRVETGLIFGESWEKRALAVCPKAQYNRPCSTSTTDVNTKTCSERKERER